MVFEEGIFNMSPKAGATSEVPEAAEPGTKVFDAEIVAETRDNLIRLKEAEDPVLEMMSSIGPDAHHRRLLMTPTDPVVAYARR